MIVATFAGPVQYVLHDGSQDPRSPRRVLLHGGPAIGTAERSRLLAAFNGGFLMRSRAGGYEQEGHVFRGLRNGLASLVIDRSGHARIGVWGAGVPVPGESVFSVRQNLWPLVMDGRRTRETDKWWRWGGTVGHVESVARSALGQNAAGELIYAASMSATAGGPGRRTGPQRRASRHAAGHQPRMGPAGHGGGAGHGADRGSPPSGPPGQPVPDRVDT